MPKKVPHVRNIEDARRAIQKLAGPVHTGLVAAVDSAIASTAKVLSDVTSEVKASAYVDFQTNSNLISAVSNSLSAVSVMASATSDGLSVLSNAVLVGDYDADYKALLLEKI